MNVMKKSTYLVLVFALFVIEEDIYHAWGGRVNEDVDVGAQGGEEKLTTLKANYHIPIPTLSRKLLAFPGYNNSTGSDLVSDSDSGTDLVPGVDPGFSFGSGSNLGSGSSMGSNTDLVPDANPGAGTGMVSGSNPSFNIGSGGSSTDLVPDANPRTGSGWSYRIGPGGPGCSKEDIEVDQSATGPLPNGIPTYTVYITNTCVTGGCTYSNIHLSCGWFSSFILIDPDVFRRIGYDDCLLKNGATLNPNELISFVYADTYKYPLSISSLTC